MAGAHDLLGGIGDLEEVDAGLDPDLVEDTDSASTGVLPAPAPNRRQLPSICLAPARTAAHRVGDAETQVLVAVEADLRVVAELGDQRRHPVGDACSSTSAPAESTTYTHWQPASAMIRACSASFSGGWVCDIIRKPTVSRPSSRARPKCWMETSASVQWVAIRQIDAAVALRLLDVVLGAQTGQHQEGDLGFLGGLGRQP